MATGLLDYTAQRYGLPAKMVDMMIERSMNQLPAVPCFEDEEQ